MFKRTLIASAMLMAAIGAYAQSSTVTSGGIINPPSCSLTVTSNVSYGAMSASTVKSYAVSSYSAVSYYKLPMKTASYSVLCNAPVKVEAAFTDSNAGKASYTTGVEWAIVDGSAASIGFSSLGTAALTLNSNATPVAAGTVLAAPNGTTTWSTLLPNSTLASQTIAPGYALGYSTAASATVPSAVSAIDGVISFYPYLKKSYVDAASSMFSIGLGGTITLQYL